VRGGPGPGVEVDHYARLGLARDATAREVAAAFRRQARLHHPDVGGSAADFAAIEEAYRVLRDPASRAAYDADLAAAEPGDDWADVGWGVPLDEPAPAEHAAAEPPAPATPPPPHRPSADHDPYRPSPPPGTRLPPEPPRPGPVSPFGPGALALPEVDPGSADPPAPVPRWAPAAVAAAAGVAWVALVVGGVVGRIGLGWFALAGLAVPCGLGAFFLARPRRGGAVRAVIAAVLVLGPLSRGAGTGTPRPALGALVLLLILASALTAVAERLRWSLRHAAFAVQREARVRRAELLRTRAIAVEWNRVRDALRDPTARAVAAGPVAAGPFVATGEVDRFCWDPVLSASVVYRVPLWVAQGQWVVLDTTGEVTAVASHGAPEAWFEAMTGAPVRPAARR